jgi:AsmA protein
MAPRVRRLLIFASVVVALGVMTVALLLRSLQAGDLRAGIEARLSASLGHPVSIGQIGVSLFPPSLSGTDVRIGDSKVQAPALDVARVRILPRLRSLLSGDVVVEQLTLDGFVVSVLRDEKGAWHVPSAVPAPTAGSGSGPVVETVRISNGRVRVFNADLREASSIDDLSAEMRVEGGGLALSPITGRIGGAEISGEAGTDGSRVRLDFSAKKIADDDLPGFLRLLGSDRPEFLRLAEPASASVVLRVDRRTSQLSGKGTLKAPRVRLEPLQLEKFEAPFTIQGSRLVFQPMTFALYSGTHDGGVTVRLSDTPPQWITDNRVTRLDAGDFLKALNGSDQRLDGTASVTASLRGRVGQALDRTLSGNMQMTVTDGVIRDFPMLAAINRALRLAERAEGDTKFERLSGTFAIAAGQATTEDLVLQAAHLRAEVKGRIGVDHSLALRGVAVLSPERSAEAVRSIRELSALRNDSGEVELPLTISGTLEAPSFGLDLQAALEKGLKNELQRRIRRFIR